MVSRGGGGREWWKEDGGGGFGEKGSASPSYLSLSHFLEADRDGGMLFEKEHFSFSLLSHSLIRHSFFAFCNFLR